MNIWTLDIAGERITFYRKSDRPNQIKNLVKNQATITQNARLLATAILAGATNLALMEDLATQLLQDLTIRDNVDDYSIVIDGQLYHFVIVGSDNAETIDIELFRADDPDFVVPPEIYRRAIDEYSSKLMRAWRSEGHKDLNGGFDR